MSRRSTLRVPDHVADVIRALHPDIKRKVRAGIETVLADPSTGKALRDDLAGLFNLRVGQLRIIYSVERGAVGLIAVGPRATIHEETERLLRKEKRDVK